MYMKIQHMKVVRTALQRVDGLFNVFEVNPAQLLTDWKSRHNAEKQPKFPPRSRTAESNRQSR